MACGVGDGGGGLRAAPEVIANLNPLRLPIFGAATPYSSALRTVPSRAGVRGKRIILGIHLA